MKKLTQSSLPDWEDMRYLALCYGLRGCEVFKQLEPEVIAREWNGLGPDRVPEWVRSFLDDLYSEVLPAACIHDLRYVIGGDFEKFREANDELKHNMRVCLKQNRNKFTLFGYLVARIRVNIAVFLCNVFGKPGWKFC